MPHVPNFLYLALKCLKDVEHHSHLQTTELARVTVWIGELQWRLAHGYEFKTNPVLDTLEHIECRDVLLAESGAEAAWPAADVVVGNPPFLGDKNLKPNKPPALAQQAPAAIKNITPRQAATAIAQAAQRLSALRQAWLKPPEWTDTVPEVVPLGMATSPYPDRTVPKTGFEKDLAKRTLTNLYNQRPAWLAAAHAQLDTAVAAAYGWADYTADMPDDEILRRLLALNLQRSNAA